MYRLSAGIDVVPLEEDGVLFRSSTLAVRVDGALAATLGRRVLPHLATARSLDDLAAIVDDIPRDILQRGLDSLVDARVIEQLHDTPSPDDEHPLRAFFAEVGVDTSEALERLRASHVAIFGLEGHGAHVALELARLGVRHLTLADAHPLTARDALLLPPGVAPEATRQEAIAASIRSLGTTTQLTLGGPLSREAVSALVADSTVAVACFDRGFETAQHWVNRGAVTHGRPALFAELRTHAYSLGPYVIPRQTACYMCYRMRRIAAEANYDEAMAYERYLNDRRTPSLSARANATYLSAHLGSLLVNEVVKATALALPPSLAGRVLEGDSLTLATNFHSVLRVPDCPVCGDTARKPRVNPTLDRLQAHADENPRGDLRTMRPTLVSGRTGVITELDAFAKDPVEPAVPYIVRANVANHRFISKRDDDGDVCSGKGLTLDDARVSAMGEAVERYSGGVHRADEVRRARRGELDGRTLDPRALVLYAPEQYPSLPYAPYSDDTALGWLPARSLVHDDEVLVPAMSVFMNYHAGHDGEFLFPITSNGLAAGPTLADAVWSAASEVVERDAFMIAWLQRLTSPWSSAREHPHREIAQLGELYARRGVELRLYRMPTDHDIAVFAGVAVEESPATTGGPAVVIGLGADADPVLAARKAALEVGQVRPALRRRMRQPEARKRLAELLDDPTRVATIDDHDLLYADRSALGMMDFMLDAPQHPFAWDERPRCTATESLRAFGDWLRARGGDLLYVNLTPPDMAELGLYTARAILPGFQPIDFGWKERRLAGSRLYELPTSLGQTSHPLQSLNPHPHPLA